METLSIVHVLRAPVGGLFRHVVDLVRAQTAQGHRVGVFHDLSAHDARIDAVLGDAVTLGGAVIRRDPGLSDLASLARFRRWLSPQRPDVIHGHGAKGGLYARLARATALPGRPIIAYTPHGGSFNTRVGEPAHRLYMTAERALAPLTDLFLFESAFIAAAYDRFVGVDAGLRRVVVNGLAPGEFEPLRPDAGAADLLYVGELRSAKGVDTLLEALAKLCAGGRTLSLALVGAGPDAEVLREKARELGLAESVQFTGALPAREAFRRGRLFVAPSRQESMPYVVLEAAAGGLPMVATEVGGVPEIFGPYAGRLGPCDDSDDLARRIARSLDADPAARAREAEELRAYVRGRFTVAAMTDAVLSGYRDALRRRRAPSEATPTPVHTRTRGS